MTVFRAAYGKTYGKTWGNAQGKQGNMYGKIYGKRPPRHKRTLTPALHRSPACHYLYLVRNRYSYNTYLESKITKNTRLGNHITKKYLAIRYKLEPKVGV